jgi:hypothetical protein
MGPFATAWRNAAIFKTEREREEERRERERELVPRKAN